MNRKQLMLFANNGGSGASSISTSFAAALQSTLVPTSSLGSGTPTFTRASTAWVPDWENLWKQVKSSESRFMGARRVENLLLPASENCALASLTGTTPPTVSKLTYDGKSNVQEIVFASGVSSSADARANFFNSSQSVAATSAGRAYRGRFLVALSRPLTGGEAIYIELNGGATLGNAMFTAGSQPSASLSVAALSTATSPGGSVALYISPSATLTSQLRVYISEMQVEDVTGQSNTNPSEYVSVGVLSAPYQGANVDGVKYFTTKNGNTVASNVVTEATGAAINLTNGGSASTVDASGPFGYLAEGARTNRALWCRDFTNAAWVGTTMTAAKDQTGMDGVANSASSLTATGANATTLQALVIASATRTFSVWAKRITGTGAISVTADGVNYTTTAITSAWTQISDTHALLNPMFGIKIATNGDKIAVDFAAMEDATFAALSPVATTTVAVTRAEDFLSYATASNFNELTGAAYVEATARNNTGIASVVSSSSLGSAFTLFLNSATGASVNDVATSVNTTGLGTSWTAGPNKAVSSWGGVTMRVSKDAQAAASGVFDGSMNAGASWSVGQYNAGAGYALFGTVRNLRSYSSALTSVQMAAL